MRPLLLVLAAFSGGMLADAADAKPSVSLDVKVIRSGATTQLSKSANFDRVNPVRNTKTVVFERQKSGLLDLEVSVRNFARTPADVKLDWLFFAQDVGKSNLSVLSEGAKDVLLKPGGEMKVIAAAERALSTENKRWQFDRIETPANRIEAPVAHESAKAGRKIVGWLVCVSADDVVLGYKASSSRFEPFADRDRRRQIIEQSAKQNGFVR